MKYALILCLALSMAGCSTMKTKFGEESEWGTPYSGTKTSPQNGYDYLQKSKHHFPMYLFMFAFSVADFLASFAADTVLLPADLGIALSSVGEDSTEENEH